MPCKSCDNTFSIRPCITEDFDLDFRIYKLEDMISKNSKDGFRNTVKNLYRLLHNDCPCKECLVKMMCKHGVKCPTYHDLLVEAAQDDRRNLGAKNAM